MGAADTITCLVDEQPQCARMTSRSLRRRGAAAERHEIRNALRRARGSGNDAPSAFQFGSPAVAQAPLLPYATLRAVPDTHGQVWPADFNEDGITIR